MNENEFQPPYRPLDRRLRIARIWAKGTLLGNQLILAHSSDEVVAAAFPTDYDAGAPTGERRTVRLAIAARTAKLRQQQLISEWEAGVGGYDKFVLADADFAIEQALLAPKDVAIDHIPREWPEGPPLVLCRHLYPGSDLPGNEPDSSREWHDGRTANMLLRSWVEAGLLVMGNLLLSVFLGDDEAGVVRRVG